MSKELVERLRGRERYLRDEGCVKSPDLMRDAADLIERQSKALDEAMMVVWWMIGEGIVPADCDIDPDQVMLDNVENITRDSGEYWEAMFAARSLTKGKGEGE